MHEYSIAVALFDFLPVLATTLGLGWLARGIVARQPALATAAWAGAIAVPLGGACKATWKLHIALGGTPLPWLENLLFVLLAPGFAAAAFALFHVGRVWPAPASPPARGRLALWLSMPWAGALLALTWQPEGRLWFFWLLALTVFGNAALVAHAIRLARRMALGGPAIAAFTYNFAAMLAMSGLSRLPAGETTAWIQESVNLTAQAALAYGCWRLARRLHPST